MTKINLKNLSIDEVLSKDELKKIVGGNGSGRPPSNTYYCYCNNDVTPCKLFTIGNPWTYEDMALEMWYCCNFEYDPNASYHCEPEY